MQLCLSASFLVLIFLVSTLSIPFREDVKSLKMTANSSSNSLDLSSGNTAIASAKCATPAGDLEVPAEPYVPSTLQSSLRSRRFISPSVLFDNFYSIDNRGNTRHYVDDATSVAKISYPVGTVLRTYLPSALQVLKVTLPFGINVAQSM